MSGARKSTRMDTSDHGLPQLIKGPGPVANGLTDVDEMSFVFNSSLLVFKCPHTHRGLKARRQVKVGAVPRNCLPTCIDMPSVYLKEG